VNIPGLKQPGEKISYSDDMPEDLTKMTLDQVIKKTTLPEWDDAASLSCRRFPTLVSTMLEGFSSPSTACRCALLQGQSFVESDGELHQFVTKYAAVREKLLAEANDSDLEWWSERMKTVPIKNYPGRKTIYYFDIKNKVFFWGLTTQTDVNANIIAAVFITKSLLTSSHSSGRVRDALERTVLNPWAEWLDESLNKLDNYLNQK